MHELRFCKGTIVSKINDIPEGVRLSEKVQLQHSVAIMKFDRSNKFDLCYYGQVNSLRLQSSVASNGPVNNFGGNIYYAGDGT